jgi:hypothetical protein
VSTRSLGWGGVRLHEVIGSKRGDWVNEQNRHTFPATGAWTGKHYFLMGHDTSVNCLADSVQFKQFAGWNEALTWALVEVMSE